MVDGITRADITGAALVLLTNGGLHALAMRRIAAELDVQQSALYWHFDNKQQLLAAVADLVVARVEATNARKWQNRILGLGSRLRDELLRYPDGAELVATAIAFRLGAGRPHQLFTAELTRAGMGDDDARVAASVFVHFVVGYTTDEQQHHQAAELGAIDRLDVATGRFDQGLRLIVAGAEAQIATLDAT